MYFLVLLKRAKVSFYYLVIFYSTVIRPVIEYCSAIFHHSLFTDYLSESVQKKSRLSIIAPDKSYEHCLVSFGLSTLFDRHNDQCIKLFNSISSDYSTNSLACLLRNTEATTIPAKREFTTCPVFAHTASKAPSYPPCAVVQTCYY